MNKHHFSHVRMTRSLVATVLASILPFAVQAQQGKVFAYPNAGQSQEQQQADNYQCHQWAVGQTGFDPSQNYAAPPAQYAGQTPPAASQQQGGGLLGIGGGGMFKGGGMLGDAATGAALGAAGGALAGDAGKGAAIGALAAGVLGAASRAVSPGQPAPPPQAVPPPNYQAAPQDQQRRGEYNAAFGACMKARNYTVN